jgi:L-lactate dehydrogenase
VLTVSTMLDGEFGIRGVCLSVPCIVSAQGVEKILKSSLPEPELAALGSSAAKLMQAIQELKAATG